VRAHSPEHFISLSKEWPQLLISSRVGLRKKFGFREKCGIVNKHSVLVKTLEISGLKIIKHGLFFEIIGENEIYFVAF
jgi:hypothetical protein